MNYSEFYKEYCPVYNWHNGGEHKVYCNPFCPNFIGLSKRTINKKLTLIALCEIEEIKEYEKYLNF